MRSLWLNAAGLALLSLLAASCTRPSQPQPAAKIQQKPVDTKQAPKAVAVDQNFVLRVDGIGPAKIGMSPEELRNALGEKLAEDEPSGSENCFYLSSKQHPQLFFMIEDGHLSRIDVSKPGILNSEAIQVGDPVARVKQIYGPKLQVEDHHYAEGEHYLTVHSGKYGIRFETNAGKIDEFYAGLYESIQYVEGCL